MNVLDKKWNEALSQLTPKEQQFFKNIKKYGLDIGWEKVLKPIAIGVTTFWIFTKINDTYGLEKTVFIILIIVMLYLRSISSSLSKLVG